MSFYDDWPLKKWVKYIGKQRNNGEDGQTDRQIDKKTDRHTDKKTDRQTDTRKGRQTYYHYNYYFTSIINYNQKLIITADRQTYYYDNYLLVSLL